MDVAELQEFQKTFEETIDPGKNTIAKLEVLAK